MKTLQRLKMSIRKTVILPIRFYRFFISPWVGNNCRFTPTCSVYTMQAILTHGVIKGIFLGTKRLAKCQPWCHGGHDPVPPAK